VVPVVLSSMAGRELARVVDSYLNVAAALAADDAVAARTAARGLEAALRSAGLNGLDAEPAREWRRAREELQRRAATIGGMSDIAAARSEMLPLSVRMEAVVATFRSDEVGPLYRAACPMVQGREGTWLTRTEVVENPYYGAAMFDCGEVQAKVAG
jgi:membrane fusion protein, copper/silver efflux system